jgi:hypothetical protein
VDKSDFPDVKTKKKEKSLSMAQTTVAVVWAHVPSSQLV